ncbi:MAG: protease modulator HflC [Candidatus Omnitrophica bacterium]|nr:protease modulator HflC [Candidatus Omnitrophota bacterium]
MKQGIAGLLIVLLSLSGLTLINCAYTVDETEQVVITQFGEPVTQPISTPGLHWKAPWWKVHKFDKRILNWDGYPSEVPTRDKKFIWVDVTGRWRIDDPLQFLQTMHNELNAQTRLDDIMDGVTRNYITRYNLVDIVRTSNRILEVKPEDAGDIAAETDYDKIEIGRDAITREILETAKKILSEYGIKLIDLRIKRINYIENVRIKVFERMISERKRAAEQLRSEGQGVRAEVEGQKDKELKRIQSEAYREVQKIRGQADAESTQTYGQAYSQDPEFFAYMSTLEKYPAAIRNGRLVLTTESDFLKYLKKAE